MNTISKNRTAQLYMLASRKCAKNSLMTASENVNSPALRRPYSFLILVADIARIIMYDMIERIFRLIVDKHVPVTKLLVVTFTTNSASDMKKKLIKKLTENSSDPFVLEQIDDIAVSDISNLHSFCSRLISTYFYEAGVDPSYHIIDEREAYTLKNKALTLKKDF